MRIISYHGEPLAEIDLGGEFGTLTTNWPLPGLPVPRDTHHRYARTEVVEQKMLVAAFPGWLDPT